jgi:hypothetical protein
MTYITEKRGLKGVVFLHCKKNQYKRVFIVMKAAYAPLFSQSKGDSARQLFNQSIILSVTPSLSNIVIANGRQPSKRFVKLLSRYDKIPSKLITWTCHHHPCPE